MYKQISYDEAVSLISSKTIVIADVRDSESYERSHITDAVHLSIPALQEFCDQSDKLVPILVYCHHGISSRSAAQHLVDQGFLEVYSLDGGFELWKSQYSA